MEVFEKKYYKESESIKFDKLKLEKEFDTMYRKMKNFESKYKQNIDYIMEMKKPKPEQEAKAQKLNKKGLFA